MVQGLSLTERESKNQRKIEKANRQKKMEEEEDDEMFGFGFGGIRTVNAGEYEVVEEEEEQHHQQQQALNSEERGGDRVRTSASMVSLPTSGRQTGPHAEEEDDGENDIEVVGFTLIEEAENFVRACKAMSPIGVDRLEAPSPEDQTRSARTPQRAQSSAPKQRDNLDGIRDEGDVVEEHPKLHRNVRGSGGEVGAIDAVFMYRRKLYFNVKWREAHGFEDGLYDAFETTQMIKWYITAAVEAVDGESQDEDDERTLEDSTMSDDNSQRRGPEGDRASTYEDSMSNWGPCYRNARHYVYHEEKDEDKEFAVNKEGILCYTKLGRKLRNLPEIVHPLRTESPDDGEDQDPSKGCDQGPDEECGSANYRELALSFLTSSLKKRTMESYQSSWNAWNVYLIGERIGENYLSYEWQKDDKMEKSRRAEELFMGFVMHCVEYRQVTVQTAEQYKNNVKNRLLVKTGLDIQFNMEWKRMSLLLGRLRRRYPHKRRVRKPFMQQNLLWVRRVLDAYKKGKHSARKIGTHLDIREDLLHDFVELISKFGPETIWAALVSFFFGVSRGGDSLPQNHKDFDKGVDSTVSDVRWAADGYSLNIKETKMGVPIDFEMKPYCRVKGHKLCPVDAMAQYLKVHPLKDEDPSCTPLYVRKDKKPMVTADLREIVQAAAKAQGLVPSEYGAHSLRIGGATAAGLCKSGTALTCKVLGFWLSDQYLEYMTPTREQMTELVEEMVTSTTKASCF